MTYAKVTSIDSLPELDDLEHNTMQNNDIYSGLNMIPKDQFDRVNKFVKGYHKTPLQTGM